MSKSKKGIYNGLHRSLENLQPIFLFKTSRRWIRPGREQIEMKRQRRGERERAYEPVGLDHLNNIDWSEWHSSFFSSHEEKIFKAGEQTLNQKNNLNQTSNTCFDEYEPHAPTPQGSESYLPIYWWRYFNLSSKLNNKSCSPVPSKTIQCPLFLKELQKIDVSSFNNTIVEVW